MKQMKPYALTVLMLLLAFAAYGQDARTYKFFTSTSAACPIRVVVNGETYAIVKGTDRFTMTLAGNPTIKAYDKYGEPMRIRREGVYDGSHTYIQHVSVDIGAGSWRHVERNNQQQQNGSSANDWSEEPYTETDTQGYDEPSADTQPQYSGWDNLANSVRMGTGIPDPAYPNITFQGGLSRVHGEFLRAKACFGGATGYIIYGGIGHDWIFNAKNDDYIGQDAKKLAWHAGLGYYGGDLNGETTTAEFAFMMDYAQTPMVEGGSVNAWAEGTWYFGADGHFGAFGGLGVSWGNIKDDNKSKWNFIFEIGLAYRFF